MFSTTINYDVAGNLSYDANLVETIGGLTKLKKLALLTDETFMASYREGKDADRAIGSTTVVTDAANIVNISGTDYLDLRGAVNGQYVSYDDANAFLTEKGCFRCKITPDYTGAPSGAHSYIFHQSLALGSNSSGFRISHNTTGDINMVAFSSASSTRLNVVAPWSPVAGQEYELEINFDFAQQIREIYIDGVMLAKSTDTMIATWGLGAVGFMAIGSAGTPVSTSGDFLIRDIKLFSEMQHTANYTAPIANPLYPATAPSIVPNSPIITDGLGSFAAVESTTDSESGVLHIANFQGNDFYWDGAAWVVSDVTIAQANTLADFTANIATLDVTLGGNYVHKILLNSPNGYETSTITSTTLGYDFFQIQGACDTCIVTGYVLDNCMPIEGATISFKSKTFVTNGNLQSINEVVTTNVYGYFEIALAESSTANVTVSAILKYTDTAGKGQSSKMTLIIPNQASALLEDIIQ